MNVSGTYRKRPFTRSRRQRHPFYRVAWSVVSVPSAPSLDSVTVDPTGLTPAWSDTDAGGSAILFYEVWRSVNGGGYTLFYTSPDNTVTDTADVTTTEGQVVGYKVRAKNGGGYSPFSNVNTQTSQGPDLLPQETSASVNAAGTTLTVNFSEDVVGVVANQYTLSGGHTLSSPVGSGSGGLHGTSWAFTVATAVVHGETLTIGYGGASTKDTTNNLLAAFSGRAVTNNVPLSTPTIDADSTEATPTATVVGWFAVTGATGYKIQRSLDGSAWGTAVTLGNVLTYSDTTTTLGVSYYYRVAATDDVPTQSSFSAAFGPISALGPGGAGGSPLTAPTIAFVDSTPTPSIVIGMTVVASGGQDPKRYDLYRSTTSGFTPSGSPVIANASFPATDADAGLTHGVVYYYKVVATDGLGQTATSGQVSAGLPFDGTGGTGGTGTVSTATITAATIDGSGRSLSLTFSKSVAGLDATDFTLSTGENLSNATGSGTDWALAIDRVITDDEAPTLTYAGTAVVDSDDLMLSTFAGLQIANGSAMTTGSPFPVASTYATQSDIEDIFGVQNVLTRSDLQNTGIADTDRIARALTYADTEINLFFRDGPFTVPLTGHFTATLTRKWAATLGGVWLYENRGTRDDDKEGHHYTVKRAQIVTEMAMFKSGTLRLDAPRRWPSPSAPAAC